MDSGNDRKNAAVVQALIERPKSVLYDAGKDDKQKKVIHFFKIIGRAT